MKNWTRWLLGALLLVGCAGTGGSSATSPYLVVKESTPLMESGPNQTTPATRTLESGTRVRIINNAGSSAYVETVDGSRGFIPASVLEEQRE
ncbi:MAG: hypothetical protein V1746_08515 [bacterium]